MRLIKLRRTAVWFSAPLSGSEPNTPPAGTDIVDNPTIFDTQPYSTTTQSGIKTTGKKKTASGSIAKLLHDVSHDYDLLPSTRYVLEYSADYSAMSDSGLSVEIGFLFRAGNDFYLIGLKGDGAGGLTTHRVQGPGGWNQTSGFTEIDDGAPAYGTVSGPNYIQMDVSEDGTTITFSTSGDGVNFTIEVADAAITPFSDVGGVGAWGPGAFIPATDDGTFVLTWSFWNVTPILTTNQSTAQTVAAVL